MSYTKSNYWENITITSTATKPITSTSSLIYCPKRGKIITFFTCIVCEDYRKCWGERNI